MLQQCWLTFGINDLLQNDTSYFGSIVGRVANRIGGAQFTIDGIHYKLKPNEKNNMLHGNQLLLFSTTTITIINVSKEKHFKSRLQNDVSCSAQNT